VVFDFAASRVMIYSRGIDDGAREGADDGG